MTNHDLVSRPILVAYEDNVQLWQITLWKMEQGLITRIKESTNQTTDVIIITL